MRPGIYLGRGLRAVRSGDSSDMAMAAGPRVRRRDVPLNARVGVWRGTEKHDVRAGSARSATAVRMLTGWTIGGLGLGTVCGVARCSARGVGWRVTAQRGHRERESVRVRAHSL